MMRVALVHDWLNQLGGAENVLETLVALFPSAPVYTSMYAPHLMPARYRAWDIRTTFMQHLPGIFTHHQAYLPLYPLAFGRLRLQGYDLILSNKSGFCHGVPAPAGAIHICYCLTPTRFLWQYDLYRQREALSPRLDLALRPLIAALRRWDYAAAQRVHHFVAISTEIQERIRRFYGRESTIIYPPVEVERFRPSGEAPGDYFLAGGRLIPYKRTDLAVAACTALGAKLLVYGDGRDRPALEKMAGPTVTFLGRVSADELARLYAGAKAFIFPGLEDFGIAPVEAQAAGRPVIAFRGGGALDTVIPGRTGEFFAAASVEALQEVLARFDPAAYDPAACRANAERFSSARFRRELGEFIRRKMAA
ncbi:MAG: glycosyltransferase [Anaerolineae bacterium]|nr:glycosyltransferase [Anaerolineae bacterium]